jgi:hypothetical protein
VTNLQQTKLFFTELTVLTECPSLVKTDIAAHIDHAYMNLISVHCRYRIYVFFLRMIRDICLPGNE